VRDDQPRRDTCLQLALAVREEVQDLEKADVGIIQIDEAALREGLPLRQSDWNTYLEWAIEAFRISANGVEDDTQIHTHMCYSEFNDIIAAIARMDADVITIETSRSAMELLDAFKGFEYPNDIGPGVYDIHSPNIPQAEQVTDLMKKAAERIPAERLWVNPDCGLKTRRWEEVIPALEAMVSAAKELRAQNPKSKTAGVDRRSSSVTRAVLIEFKLEIQGPAHFSGEVAGGLEFKPAVTRGQIFHREFARARGKLNTGGGRCQQLHAISLPLMGLVNVPPQHHFYLRKTINHLPKFFPIP